MCRWSVLLQPQGRGRFDLPLSGQYEDQLAACDVLSGPPSPSREQLPAQQDGWGLVQGWVTGVTCPTCQVPILVSNRPCPRPWSTDWGKDLALIPVAGRRNSRMLPPRPQVRPGGLGSAARARAMTAMERGRGVAALKEVQPAELSATPVWTSPERWSTPPA